MEKYRKEFEEHRIYLASEGKEGKPFRLYASELYEEDFSGVDLSRAKFNDCLIEKVTFGDSECISFVDCTFRNVSFKGATVFKGNFRNCVFEKCDFDKAVLDETSIVNSKFMCCDFSDVSLAGTDMIIVKITNSIIKCDFSVAKLYEVTVKSSFPEE